MSESLKDELDILKNLATPNEIRSTAESADDSSAPLAVNAHIHLPPNFSAFESVEQAVSLASEQGIAVLGLSNYHDFHVYGEFSRRCRAAGILPQFGLEIICLIDDLARSGIKVNDPGNPGKFYFCGKGITRFAELSPRARGLLDRMRANDAARMKEMTARLGAVFAERGLDLGLCENCVIRMIVERHGCARENVTIQERHIAQAFQEAAFESVASDRRADALEKVLGVSLGAQAQEPVAVQNAIRSSLMKAGKPAFAEESFLTFDESYELVLELGGIPCYPTLADGASPICGYETPVEDLIRRTRERGIHAVEFIPIRNRPEVLREYVTAMRSAGLVVTGGTEHNTLDLIPIEPRCVAGAPVPDDIKAIFWEGACVVAAHQFLALHGECGFVDGEGRPNPAYATDEDRIRAFARMGGEIVKRFGKLFKKQSHGGVA
ncbi:hypothetical protein JW916_09120 [Candidatus Sumerlaeota bacterium]|nr:hypothetical protein [Candidatus Sumerlaeota bacterium]